MYLYCFFFGTNTLSWLSHTCLWTILNIRVQHKHITITMTLLRLCSWFVDFICFFRNYYCKNYCLRHCYKFIFKKLDHKHNSTFVLSLVRRSHLSCSHEHLTVPNSLCLNTLLQKKIYEPYPKFLKNLFTFFGPKIIFLLNWVTLQETFLIRSTLIMIIYDFSRHFSWKKLTF